MIASLKSERLKTPNEGSKLEFHLGWIRELVPISAPARTVALLTTSRFVGTYRGSRDDSFGLRSQASFNTGSADAV
jgi:hypothetical protein